MAVQAENIEEVRDRIGEFRDAIVQSRVLRDALKVADVNEILAAVVALPPSERNRMLSSLGAPASKPSKATARMLKTNVGKLGPMDRQKFGAFIARHLVFDTFEAAHEMIDSVSVDDLAGDPGLAGSLSDRVDVLAAELGPSLVPLCVLASAVVDPGLGAPVVCAVAAKYPDVFDDHAGLVAAAEAATTESVEDHARRPGHRMDAGGVPDSGDVVEASPGSAGAQVETAHRAALAAAERIADALSRGVDVGDDDPDMVVSFRDLVRHLADTYGVDATVAAVEEALEAEAAGAARLDVLRVLGRLVVPDDLGAAAGEAAMLARDYVEAGVVPDADPVFDRLRALAELIADADVLSADSGAELFRVASADTPPQPGLVYAAVTGKVTVSNPSPDEVAEVDGSEGIAAAASEPTAATRRTPSVRDGTDQGHGATADGSGTETPAGADGGAPVTGETGIVETSDVPATTSRSGADNISDSDGPAGDAPAAAESPAEDAATESDAERSSAAADKVADTASPGTSTAGTSPDDRGSVPKIEETGDAHAGAVAQEAFEDHAAQDHAVEEGAYEELVADGEVHAALLQTVADGRFGLGHHLARLSGRDHIAAVLKEATHAHAVRASTSPSARAMAEDNLGIEPNEHDLGSLALRVASAVRVALLAPHSDVLTTIASIEHVVHTAGLDELVEILAAARESATQGVAIPATGEQFEADEIIERQEAAREAAQEQLDTDLRVSLYRGWGIWNTWIAPDGPLGSMMTAVAQNDTSQLSSILEQARRLSVDRNIMDMIRDADKEHRSSQAEEITGNARTQLANAIQQVATIARTWVEATSELDAGGKDVRTKLATTFASSDNDLDRLLVRVPGGDWAGAAVRAAIHSLRETAALLSNEGLSGADLDPVVALNRGLLLSAEIPIDPDTTEVSGELNLAAVVEAARASRYDGVRDRVTARDYGAAEAICRLVSGRPGEDFNAESAREQIRNEEERDHTATRARWESLRDQVRSDVSRGRIVGADETRFRSALTAAEPGEKPRTGRRDLGRVESELTDIEHAMAATRASRADAIVAAIRDGANDPESGSRVARAQERLTGLVAAGELAAAEEFLARAKAQLDLPEVAEGDQPSRFALEVVSAPNLHELSAASVEAARSGAMHGPFDFSGGTETRRAQAAEALRAWINLRDRNRPDEDEWEPVLRLILPALGITVSSAGLDSNQTPRDPDRVWLRALADKNGLAFVPIFGSGSRGRWRILITWKSPTPAAVYAAATRDSAETPVLVLYMGALSADDRLALVVEARRSRAGRVLVVDDTLFTHAVAAGDGTFAEVAKAALPASGANPYNSDVEMVAEEMFYGRVRERQSVLSMTGTNFISGGRRFGKSALLHAARLQIAAENAKQAKGDPPRRVVLANLRDTPTTSGTPADVWGVLGKALTKAGIVEEGTVTADTVVDAVFAWLSGDADRSLLLLLDECDEFLRQDAAHRFGNVIKLRELWSASEHRFKVVFAGLQHVSRFQNQPNQPVSQLVAPITVGPLDATAAAQLLTRPLAALGFELSASQVDRVVAWSWCNASLLQRVGAELLNRLYSTKPDGLWPWLVDDALIDDLLQSPMLESEWKKRLLSLTLDLDHRYKLIAYLLAAEAHRLERSEPVDVANLWRQAREAWPAGFVDTSIDEFRALGNEMVGMRILAEPSEGKLQLFSPQVRRAFGDADEVNELVTNASNELDLPARMSALTARYGTDGPDGPVGPLSLEQLTDTVGPGSTQLRIVLGSRALGLDRVAPTVASYAKEGAWGEVVVPDPALVSSKSAWKESMTPPADSDKHAVVISDRFRATDVSLDAWTDTLEVASRIGVKTTTRGTRSAVVVAQPTTDRLSHAIDGEYFDRFVSLNRLSRESVIASVRAEHMRALLHQDIDLLLEVTGGWPLLVDRVLARVGDGVVFTESLAELKLWLADPKGAREFVAAAGLDVDDDDAPADPAVAGLFAKLVEYELSDPRNDVLDLLADDADCVVDDLQDAWEVLEALRAVVPVAGGPSYEPEPVLAAAWTTFVQSSAT